MKKLIMNTFCILAFTACSTNNEQSSHSSESPNTSFNSGINMANFDRTTRAQDDLFRHVNGTWLEEFDIPADKSNYGTFTKLAEEADKNVRRIIEEAAKSNPNEGTNEQKVGDLYKSFMDEVHLETLGIQPLQSELTKIDNIKTLADLSEYMAYAQMMTTSPFYVYVYIDDKAPDTYITQMGQSGLGLPSRDSYIKDDAKTKEIQTKYVKHMENMFNLAGLTHAKKMAGNVFNIEMQLAKAQWAKEKLRNPVANYNKRNYTELQSLMPNINWARWREAAMLEKMDQVLIGQPDYFSTVNKLLKDIPINDWKNYYTWHLITNAAPYLNKALSTENFNFYGTVLSGVEEQEPRWKRGVSTINRVLGEVVGEIYVAKHFKPEAKEKMQVMVENLREAYRQGIVELEWMSENTKKQALDKLNKFTPKVGYPDKWKDYSKLSISADDLFGNITRATLVEVQRNREKLGKPIDKTEWGMNPQTVNAYYNPSLNEIVFPAAILQPPFFNLEADDAVNYGGIGAVIGHEMGHGFDDQGSQYDGDGKLNNWWTDTDRIEFEKRTGKLVNQYDNFTVLDDVHINGEFTQGENIGDLSGLTIAFKAYQLSKNGKTAPIIDNLTGDQRVFIGWAQVWARKYRDEELRRRIDTDPHSPSEFRTNGIVMNMSDFYTTFDVKEGDKLYLPPKERVKIW